MMQHAVLPALALEGKMGCGIFRELHWQQDANEFVTLYVE